MDLDKYTSELIEKDGILFSKSQSNISYPAHGNEECFQIEENSFWFNHRNNCIIESVKRYSPGEHFFDIGGGNGFVAKGLENKGISTVLVEPGINGCLNARKRELKNIVCSTLENASFKKGSIPAAGLFDVVEHIEDDVSFLRSIHDFLTDGGHLYVTVPAFGFLWSNEDVEAGHFRRYTLKQLEDKLKSIGFDIVSSTYIFSVLPVAVYLFRALPAKLGLKKGSKSVEEYKKDHEVRKGLSDKVLNWIWDKELKRIGKGKKIPIGGSCFVIAKKRSQ